MKDNLKFNNPAFYNNRELSWLAFNERVLEEAMDNRNLLFERFKFLAIFQANLDEFFMVRVAGLKDQVKAGFKEPDNKFGLKPKEQLAFISKKTNELIRKQYHTYSFTLLPLLQQEKIEIVSVGALTNTEKVHLENYFLEEIYPVLTPRIIDSYHPFPKFLSKSLNLAVIIESKEEINKEIEALGGKLGVVQVPSVIDRLVRIEGEENSFVLLEDIIRFFIEKLFCGFQIISVSAFRITRNADLTIHEDGASDLLLVISEELKKRKWGAEVRLEMMQSSFDERILSYLQKKLAIHVEDTYLVDGPLDLTFLFSLYSWGEEHREKLVDKPFQAEIPKGLASGEEIFETLLLEDKLLHHPYDSFMAVVDFIHYAASDPSVLAIKQTLYRVSKDSPIISALKKAAINGKQVTVLVELKARFDEENNVTWAKELEKEGCHVIYGMLHLKTHSKITLIVRKRKGKIERFVHLGTGNYNEATAKLYTDTALLTANRKIGEDATNFFNYIGGLSEKPVYHYLTVAPHDIREDLIALIDEEIRYHKLYDDGHIIIKINSFTDDILIKKCYEASIAAVKIDLIVRGVCSLRPGLKGISENIRVISIVGRFLEHSRIFYFYHHGEEKTYFSSADLMTRNMEMRIEILFPILAPSLKKNVKEWLLLYLADNEKARQQDENGTYHYIHPSPGAKKVNSQLDMKDKIDARDTAPIDLRRFKGENEIDRNKGIIKSFIDIFRSSPSS